MKEQNRCLEYKLWKMRDKSRWEWVYAHVRVYTMVIREAKHLHISCIKKISAPIRISNFLLGKNWKQNFPWNTSGEVGNRYFVLSGDIAAPKQLDTRSSMLIIFSRIREILRSLFYILDFFPFFPVCLFGELTAEMGVMQPLVIKWESWISSWSESVM